MAQIKNNMQTAIDLAWAAGFYDGEGCTMSFRIKHHRYTRTIISQKDTEVLIKFKNIVGCGKIYTRTDRQLSYWQTCNEKDARKVIEMIYPYLGSIKQCQANKAINNSTWHDRTHNQLLCNNNEHRIVQRKGRRACLDCTNERARNKRKVKKLEYYQSSAIQ